MACLFHAVLIRWREPAHELIHSTGLQVRQVVVVRVWLLRRMTRAQAV